MRPEQRRHVYVENEVARQFRLPAVAGGPDDGPPDLGKESGGPAMRVLSIMDLDRAAGGPPVRVLSYAHATALDDASVSEIRRLAVGPIQVTVPAEEGIEPVVLRDLATRLDRDLLVTRAR